MSNPENIVTLDPAAELSEAKATYMRAKAERDRLKAEIAQMSRQLFEASDKDALATDAHALAYLDRLPTPEIPTTIRLRLEQARSSLAVVERACVIGGERCKKAQLRIDSRAVAAARPQHLQNALRVANALVELAVALEA